MSRHPEIEAILAAWYEADTCSVDEWEEKDQILNEMIAAIADRTSGLTAIRLKELLSGRYYVYLRARKKFERLHMPHKA